ncbi:tRNA glutamyl-Q(34) synthetase GluQRS [Altererythrobacter xixiisoli]|uniref:tRNA glutamyl-Q(34) synthetase GluQRS n=1 Tax=Croceibacterium xixiisoli TaxID=1476466 RepID=A0A6I4TYJ1_9SPHN|nr:tRNA glutamyl-Q(34) synthetase GluQRS [Croceibacterium xixiisoli]MXP00170.1 tRNA glutamyl-Q(34) synthetase GluQRS [Croceibacterium xixiisoli]
MTDLDPPARPPATTRFAPSPNGGLHLGHAWSAIMAQDLAHAAGGRFLLRIEDIDGTRSRPELADVFRRDLEWLGLEWDEVAPQSTRTARYDAAAEQLRALGLLYPCRCSRAEIAAAATRSGPDGLVYPGTCRRAQIDPQREEVAWRIDMARALQLTGPLRWTDALAGDQQARPEAAGDVILVRKDRDTPASYHLAATLDDADDGVTLVTRGMDLFEASHIHRLLQTLLQLPVPIWHHHPLLIDSDGRKLAKRRNAPTLADRREAGEDGRALAEDLRTGRLPAGLSLGSAVESDPCR